MKLQNKSFKKNALVYWKWLGREIRGTVIEVYFEPITKTIKGKNIKRNGSEDCPAYLVEAESGNLALKLQTELLRKEQKNGF
jgi:Hypervirulence associated proteins TUDOR domain